MSSRVIPKENLTAYQRWELGAVEHDRADSALGDLESKTGEGAAVDSAGFVLPTAADLERIHQEAYQEGYDLGVAEGKKAGFEQGIREGESYLRQLSELTTALDVERVRQDELIAQEVLDLALVVARQMIRAALMVKEEIIIEVIREALANLPSMAGQLLLMVHPDDLTQVRDWVTREQPHPSFKIVPDMQMERGAFRFENSTTEMDGKLATRWREIIACLGTDLQWLE